MTLLKMDTTPPKVELVNLQPFILQWATIMLFGLCCAVVVLALVTGGGTNSGFYGDVAVQFLSIPLLLTALWPAFDDGGDHKKKARVALAVCSICAFVVLMQVCPLPFDVWAGRMALLPGGDETRFGAYHPGWSTISITPQATWAAAVSLLVPLSLFASAMQLDLRQRMHLCWLLLGIGAISLALGFLQVTQGLDSALRFYEGSNDAVGFFGNRNHFAAFLNVTLILSALWLMRTMDAFWDRRALNTSSVVWFAAAAALVVAIVAGQALARSRAGAILAIAALPALSLLFLTRAQSPNRPGRDQRKTGVRRLYLAVSAFAAIFALQVGLGHIIEQFENDVADDLRIPLNVTTFETALKALPFGTGLGSFVPVYSTVEKSQTAVAAFANRAHDDLAEFLLETGLIGAGLVVFFLVWLVRQFDAVRRQPKADEDPLQLLLLRASTLILTLLLAHSLVDYPLRTTALSAVFAIFCGFLAGPAYAPFRGEPRPRQRRAAAEPPKAVPQTADELSPGIQWPMSWQNNEKQT